MVVKYEIELGLSLMVLNYVSLFSETKLLITTYLLSFLEDLFQPPLKNILKLLLTAYLAEVFQLHVHMYIIR